jgi:hypothetical protein
MPKGKYEKVRLKRERALQRQESQRVNLPTPSESSLSRAKAIANAHALQGLIKAEVLSEIFSSQNKPLLRMKKQEEAASVIQKEWRKFNSSSWLRLMRASDVEIDSAMSREDTLKTKKKSLLSEDHQQEMDLRFRQESRLTRVSGDMRLEATAKRDKTTFTRQAVGRSANMVKSASESTLTSVPQFHQNQRKVKHGTKHPMQIARSPKEGDAGVVSTAIGKIDTWHLRGV